MKQLLEVPGIGSELPIPFAEAETRWSPMTEKIDPAVLFTATVNLFALGVIR